MTELTPAVRRTQMSPRDRRRFFIAFVALMALLFAGGVLGWVLDFSHQKICVGGKTPLQQSTDELGQVSYLCPGATTVTPGFVP
jgi:hypothetical protein